MQLGFMQILKYICIHIYVYILTCVCVCWLCVQNFQHRLKNVNGIYAELCNTGSSANNFESGRPNLLCICRADITHTPHAPPAQLQRQTFLHHFQCHLHTPYTISRDTNNAPSIFNNAANAYFIMAARSKQKKCVNSEKLAGRTLRQQSQVHGKSGELSDTPSAFE